MNTTTKEVSRPDPASASSGPARTIKLSKPVDGHGGPLTQIVLREPTFDDYLKHGDVSKASRSDDGAISFAVDRVALIGWAETLSGVDRLTLGALAMKDVNRLTQLIVELVGAEGN